jgi:hypothetical protein
MSSTQDWSYARVAARFGESGCSVSGCSFSHPQGCASASVLCCALNLSNAVVEAGYSLPSATDVNYCDHAGASAKRVRNADGMARVVKAQNGGRIDASGWANRPSWKGIVYFEGGLSLQSLYADAENTEIAPADFASVFRATGHIDLWDGEKGVHAQYPNSSVIWFFRLSA